MAAIGGRQESMADRKHLRITAVQANPTVGAFQANLDIVRAKRAEYTGKTDLLVFSESFVAGYPLGDLVLRPGFMRDVRRAVDGFAAEIEGDGGPAVLLGAPREGGGRPFNAAYLIETDGTMQVALKHRLPNEEVYDELRTFAEGPVPRPMRFRGFSLGVLICEDFWHGDVVRGIVEEGAEILVVINGSHFKVGKQETRTALAHEAVRRTGIPVVYVNQVCGQDELVFDGGTFAMTRHGGLLAEVAFEATSFTVLAEPGEHGLEMKLAHDDRHVAFGHRYPGDRVSMYLAMVLGLRDYVNKNGFPGVVIGMSGGIDSALSAAVAVDALGPERVLLVRLPSTLTSKASMDDAEEASAMLGTRMETIPINAAVDGMRGMVSPLFEAEGRTAEDTTEENIQARVRGMTLMALSNKLGQMVLTTGNKSEMAVGYATLYGDMCGGFSVLKDCYKTDVFALCRWRNENFPKGVLGPAGPVMPMRIIDKPPSAELKEGQTDEASLGSYDHLDAVLKHMVEGLNGAARAAALASADTGETVTVTYAERIARLVWKAQYKREQSPPGVVLTARNFGKGWRLPIVNGYGI